MSLQASASRPARRSIFHNREIKKQKHIIVPMVMPVDEDLYDKLITEVTGAISGLSLGFDGDDEEEDEFFEVSAQPKDEAVSG